MKQKFSFLHKLDEKQNYEIINLKHLLATVIKILLKTS